MANPIFPIVVPKGTITKVATAVTDGNLMRKKISTKYRATYRLTGEVAPTDIEEFTPMFTEHPDREEIGSTDPIDIYVYCESSDGLLRLDA